MKKKTLTVAVILSLCAAVSMQSCIGKFALTNRLLSWNQSVGNKFVNELVFFAFWVLPVYEVSALADVIVLNSIEFWSGENPLASTKTTKIEGHDGQMYAIQRDANGYTITSEQDGSVVRLDFNADDQSWNVTTEEGETYEIFAYVDDTHVSLPTADGSRRIVSLDAEGVMAYRAAVENSYALAR
jgi:hypothetical protein